MGNSTSTKTLSAKIASHTPGRIRFKLKPYTQNRKTIEAMCDKLSSLEGIHKVRFNPSCASVTVHYDKAVHSMASILSFLEDMDVVIESIGHLAAGENGVSAEGNHLTSEFIEAIDDLNWRIRQITGIPFDLKLVLPLTFLGAGIWSIGKKGLMIESVPGWLFMWLALDIFIKLHPPRQSQS